MIEKIGSSFATRAAAQGKQFMNIPLINKQTAKVLWNENSVDCYIMKNGRVVGGCGSKGPADFILSEIETLFGKLEKIAVPGYDFQKTISRGSLSNVK